MAAYLSEHSTCSQSRPQGHCLQPRLLQGQPDFHSACYDAWTDSRLFPDCGFSAMARPFDRAPGLALTAEATINCPLELPGCETWQVALTFEKWGHCWIPRHHHFFLTALWGGLSCQCWSSHISVPGSTVNTNSELGNWVLSQVTFSSWTTLEPAKSLSPLLCPKDTRHLGLKIELMT